MRARFALILLALCVALAAALGSEGASGFSRGTATITPGEPQGGRQLVLQVERARTPAQRAQGLMARRTLGLRAGMVFEYEHPTSGGFWMKDTLIPLDIAFYDGRGRILRTFTMTPCRTSDCPVYDPGVAFRGALEVNAGSFRRWGVGRGDRIVVRPT